MTLPPSLAKRFEARRVLGRGGFGSVLLCLDRETGGEVALKVLSMAVDDAQLRQRFDREARVTEGLSHPHIVRVLDHGILEGVPFIAYEVIPGESLAERLERSGPAREPEVERWALGIASALAASHRAGVVHRDVKPENILLRANDDAVLCDFGVARKPAAATFHTAEGVVLGTPAFLAPEVWQGLPPGPQADQFAWAATFYQALTGRTLYGSSEPNEVLQKVLEQAPLGTTPTPERPALGRTLARAGAYQEAARFPDMASVMAALHSSQAPDAGETIAHEVTGPGRPSPKPTQVLRARPTAPQRITAPAGRVRKRRSRALLAALFCACMVGGYLGTSTEADPAPPPVPVEPVATDTELEKRWQKLVKVEADMRRFFFKERAPEPWKTPKDFHGWLYAEAFADPAAPFKWRRMMRALVAWSAEAARQKVFDHPDAPTNKKWPVNAYDRRVRTISLFLQSILARHRESFTEAWSIEGRALLDSAEMMEKVRSVRIRYVEVCEVLQNLLPDLVPADIPAPLPLRTLQISIAQLAEARQVSEWYPDVFRGILSNPFPEAVSQARFVYLQGLGSQAGSSWLTCAEARKRLGRLQLFLLDEWKYRDINSVRRRSVHYLLQEALKLVNVCPQVWTLDLRADIEALVVQAERLARQPKPENHVSSARWAESAERRLKMASFPDPAVATDWRRRIAAVKVLVESP